MTPRRRQILDFIRSQVATGNRSPSLDEIAAACGLKSRSAAHKHVKALEASGELEVTSGQARSARPKQPKLVSPGIAPLFEISIQDVIDLNDLDLRELTARLCMSELAGENLPPTSVSWGGDQRAPDGGIDVRVQLPTGARTGSRFRRATIGFQVKATRMGLGDIQREMCPNGLLRPSIKDLIRTKGTYIIVTSDSAADGEYQRRLSAMRAAVSSEVVHQDTELDYYDARRLADWTNQHPGVVAWVRTRLGRPLQGWKPFGQWADTRGNQPQLYLPDEKHRFAVPREPDRKFSLTEGLIHVRNVLRTGGRSIRLTGLSGVGKTRFVQALFEGQAASDPLPPEWAVYCDTSSSPNPPPLAVLDELLGSRRFAIMIIDNCGSQLHNQLTARCKSSDRVSLITIEYDIREDFPNETNVFRLEAGSPDLIEKVIKQQFPHISGVNVATITKFADGNSRVALALANTLERNESLAGLNDRDLFDRLFWLGKEFNPDLLVAAQACALVYSFDGEDLDGELAQLALLADQTVPALYRHVAELEHRGLAQRRGVWRAVLPHAVANLLAARALESIPAALISRCLVKGQQRLLRSFSRRLGYLHDCPTAVSVVRAWLAADGLLGDLGSLTPPYVEILKNVAPVDPEATLAAIERAVDGADASAILATGNRSRFSLILLLRLIAYEKQYFERTMRILLAFALAEEPNTSTNSASSVIRSLFFLYLSGTHASAEQRTSWVRMALMSPNPKIQEIGLSSLTAALECYHFSSNYDFEFGARNRDYGWSPRGRDARAWFAGFIALTAEIGQGQNATANNVRDVLARQFRGLWTGGGMADALEAASVPLLAAGWEKGWLSIRQTIRFDTKGLPPLSTARLRRLEERAKPTTLVGRIKSIVLNGNSAGADFADGEEVATAYERADILARELGELAAQDEVAFITVLPLVVKNEQGRQWMFGEGLATATNSIDTCWAELVAAFESTPETQRNIQVLRGFQSGVFKRAPASFDFLLDEAMERPSLKIWVPVLQLSAPLDQNGCRRLVRSMDNPSVPAWVFQYLGFGGATQALSDDTLGELLERLSIKPDGLEIAVEVLSMHIYGNPNHIGPQVVRVATSLLTSYPLNRQNHRMDYSLASLIEFFLVGSDGATCAREILIKFRKGLKDYTLSKYDFSDTIKALFKSHPRLSLDILLGDDVAFEVDYILNTELSGGRHSSPISEVPIETLIEWCEAGDPTRFARLAPLLATLKSAEDQGQPQWSDNVLTFLARSPSPIDVAESLVGLLEPMGWIGSRAETITRRLPLLDALETALGPQHSERVSIWRSKIARTIEREARQELEEYRDENESFE